MKEVAKLQIKDRTELFQATAISMGMQPNVYGEFYAEDDCLCSYINGDALRYCDTWLCLGVKSMSEILR